MTTKHYAPSMTFTESEVRLPTRGTVGVTKTGMLLPASKGPGNIPINIRSESELYETFGYPTEYNYKDWFNAAGYLKYASELYVIRPVNTDWTTAGIAIKNDGGTITIEEGDRAGLYNEDKAEYTLDNLGTTITATDYLIEFNAKSITTSDEIAVAVVSKDDVSSSDLYWGAPIFTETATYINQLYNEADGVETIDVTLVAATATTAAYYTATIGGVATTTITHGYTVVEAVTGDVYALDTNDSSGPGDATFVDTSRAVVAGTSGTIVYVEDGVNNKFGYLSDLVEGACTLTAVADGNDIEYQPPFNSVLTAKNVTLGITDYVVPQYLGSSLYGTDKLPVSFSDVIKPKPDFLRLELGVVVLKKDTQGYWQLAETFVGSWDASAKTTSGLSKHIKSVINRDSKYVYCHAIDYNSYTGYDYDFTTKDFSVRDMILNDNDAA